MAFQSLYDENGYHEFTLGPFLTSYLFPCSQENKIFSGRIVRPFAEFNAKDALEEVRKKGFASDFDPAKKEIGKYTGDQVLVVPLLPGAPVVLKGSKRTNSQYAQGLECIGAERILRIGAFHAVDSRS